MRGKKASIIVISLLTMLTLMSFIPKITHAKTEVIIGVAQSYTGVNAPGCMMHQLYYDMIIEDYNALGGLYVPEEGTRLPITLLAYDDESDEAKCLTLITKLITEDNVDLMFAPWSTEFNVAAFPIFETYHMPAIALTCGSDAASQDMKDDIITYSFMVLGQPYEDAIQVTELLQYCNGTLGGDTPLGAWSDTRIHKVGILYRADLHGTEHESAIGGALTAAGFTVVSQAYPVDIADFSPLISWLDGQDVDVVMICGYGEAVVFVYQSQALNYNPKLIFHGPVLETPLMMYAVFGFTPGDIAGLTYYNGFPSTAYTKTPELQAWADAHRARTGFYPFPAAGPAFYTGIDCLFRAVEMVGLNDKTAIRDALRTVTWNDTLVGSVKFRIGQSLQISEETCGTITQWHGFEMEDVIWPFGPATSASIIYPKYPWNWAQEPDINRDGKVDMKDIGRAAKAFGTVFGHPRWDWASDWNRDGKVDMKDIGSIARAFGTICDYIP